MILEVIWEMILEVIPYYAPARLGYQNKRQAWHDELWVASGEVV